MNQEWYCASEAIAQIMIVFIVLIYDELKTQIWCFVNVAVTRLFFYDNMSASALDKVVTFADEVMFERKPPTSTKPEATLCDSIDLRISGQPEELCTLNVRQAKVFLISSLMKQVLKSPNKSTMINDLIKNYSKKHAEKVDYFPVSHRDSETHALRDGNLERHEVSKTEDRV